MNEEINKIIVKFFTNCANEEDLDKLENWLNVKNNTQIFDKYTETNYALDMNINEFNSKSIKKALVKKINQDKRVFHKHRLYKITKYAAAAVIVFSLGLFFQDNIFNQIKAEDAISTKVDFNTIIPGDDKATLTLEDGSQIKLEKGDLVKTQNAISNGEEIIYVAGNEKTNDLIYNYLTVPRGGQFFIVLSDGTKVWLNSESQLKYPVKFIDDNARQVELVYGEAYFDVSPSSENKGTKFKVLNQFQEIEVLGTEFNIKAYKNENNIFTTLVEGKIDIGINNMFQSLIPNQQLNLNTSNNVSIIKIIDVYNEISWKDGVFNFYNKPLSEITKTLSRWYDVDIIILNKEIEKIEFDGIIRKNRSIKSILQNLKNFGTIKNYEINDKKIILK